MLDPAWEFGDTKTNYRLKKGDRVRLLYATYVGRDLIQEGIEGTVIVARTPKVFQVPGTSLYFANVDTDAGDRIRVPHGALRRIK